MAFSPADGSSFEFFSFRAIASILPCRPPALGKPNHRSTYSIGSPHASETINYYFENPSEKAAEPA